ncbi:MAG: hypothetical protein IKI69_04950 [Oscillospiraceae bacterium]|nr:hypothetical protein [Oscillospiraceae bacterium]
MVYGVIDKESSRFYTFLTTVFEAIDNKQLNYNWLITNAEIVAHSEKLDALNTSVRWRYENGKPIAVPAPDYHFLSGEELTNMIKEDDSQWIWGVLSGFEKSIPLEEILKYPLPKADGYEGFWNNPPTMQVALASLEIVPWDGSCVLLLSKRKDIIDQFKNAFPKCQDLSSYNS